MWQDISINMVTCIITGGRVGKSSWKRATFSWDRVTLTQLGNMRTERSGHDCVVLDGTVYAIGGWTDVSLSSVEILNLDTGYWSDGPDLPYPIGDVQAVSFNGSIYVVGGHGFDGREGYDGGKILKLEGNNWVKVANTGYEGMKMLSHPPILSGDMIDCD